MEKKKISWEDFEKVEIRIGTILEAKFFKEARKPALQLKIDFGDYGILKSSAQITDNYTVEGLVGKQVAAVTNFPPKQIGPFMSECLVTGFADENNKVVLCVPDEKVPNGARLY